MQSAIWIGAAVLAVYVVPPYYTTYQLVHALEERDAETVVEIVDWPHLRDNLKNEIHSKIAKRASDAGPEAAAAANAFAGALIDGMIERGVTPENFTRLLTASEKIEAEAPVSIPELHIRSAFFGSLGDFEIKLQRGDDQPSITAVLELRNFEWKLSRLILPDNPEEFFPRQAADKTAISE